MPAGSPSRPRYRSTSRGEKNRFGGISPYLYYEDAEAALEWLSRVFGFTERVRFLDPDGVLRAAETYAGDTLVHMDLLAAPAR